jgi:hypothetical protein
MDQSPLCIRSEPEYLNLLPTYYAKIGERMGKLAANQPGLLDLNGMRGPDSLDITRKQLMPQNPTRNITSTAGGN